MSGERQRLERFSTIGNAPMALRRHLPLFIRLRGDELRKAVDKAYPLGEGPKKTSGGAQLWLQHPSAKKEKKDPVFNVGTAPQFSASPKLAEKAMDEREAVVSAGPGPQNSENAPFMQQGKPGEQMCLDAAKHYIQADYHGRHPGGWQQSDYHNKQFMQLKKQGASPEARHFKIAMEELHPKYNEVTKSQPSLFVNLADGTQES